MGDVDAYFARGADTDRAQGSWQPYCRLHFVRMICMSLDGPIQNLLRGARGMLRGLGVTSTRYISRM